MISSPFLTAADARAPFTLGQLSGLVLEVRDLAETRAFYERLFGDTGEWRQAKGQLTFSRGPQSVQFVERAKPKSLSDTGYHQAYVVPSAALRDLTGVERWYEDYPAERSLNAYLLDPSGNRVQLMAGEQGLIDHVAIELHDLELAEIFYANVLGGAVDYCHGWAMDDYAQALAEPDADESHAPWTRRYDVRYWDKLRIRRPNMQLFVRFGTTRLAIILALQHRQEPPPEQHRGTPRLIFSANQPAASLAAYFEGLHVGHEAAGDTLFLRDPAGNFVEIDCS